VLLLYTVLQKVYHPTFCDNFNISCPISAILVHLLLSHIYSAIAVPNITGIGQVGYLSIIVGGWVV